MSSLTRSLTAIKGAALMLNIVIGAGLLILPGLVVKQAGNQAIWSWLLCAVTAIPLLVVFVIMGRSFPNAGGVAHFARLAFGARAYLVTSLLFLGAVVFGLPAIALAGGHYIAEILHGSADVYAMALLVAAAGTQLLSPDLAAKMATAISSVIVAALVILAGLGLAAVNWSEVTLHTATFHALDLPTVFGPFMMIFFAFTGWEVAASLSEEFLNPKRDFPIAMALSYALALVLYLIMAFVAQNSPISGTHEAAFVSILASRFGATAGVFMSILATVIIYANLMGAIWAVSRLVFSLFREGYFAVELRTNAAGVPITSVALTVAMLLLVVGLDWVGILSVNTMLQLAGQNFLILYGIVALALAKLSSGKAIRSFSVGVVILVLGLVILQGGSLAYPVAITAFAVLLSQLTRRDSRGQEGHGEAEGNSQS
jgi:amino acid efflux transporter